MPKLLLNLFSIVLVVFGLFLFYKPVFAGQMSGYVFLDTNGDGFLNSSEYNYEKYITSTGVWQGRQVMLSEPTGGPRFVNSGTLGDWLFTAVSNNSISSLVIPNPGLSANYTSSDYPASATGNDSYPGTDTVFGDYGIWMPKPKEFYITSIDRGCAGLNQPSATITWDNSLRDPNYETYTVIRDGAGLASGLTTNTYTDQTGLTGGITYQYYILSTNSISGATTLSRNAVLITALNCSGPDINPASGISVKQDPAEPPASGFTSSFGLSGKRAAEGGKSWLNPMEITLNATPGNWPVTEYYVSFYDKTVNGNVAYSNSATFLTDIQGRLKSTPGDPKNGFLLAFRKQSASCPSPSPTGAAPCSTTGDAYYAWDGNLNTGAGGWRAINTFGSGICPETLPACISGEELYTSASSTTAAKWNIKINSGFQSKDMFTAALVIDSNNNPGFQANITPSP